MKKKEKAKAKKKKMEELDHVTVKDI